MRIILVDNETGVLRESLSVLQAASVASVGAVLVNFSKDFEAHRDDFVIVYVDGLGEVSTALSMLRFLMSGLIAQLLLITELDLRALATMADRWETLRFDELLDTGQLVIVSGSSDWRTLLVDKLSSFGEHP